MELPEYNVRMEEAMLTHIDRVGQWNQKVWAERPDATVLTEQLVGAEDLVSCGTACCVAGWVGVLSGGKFFFDPHVRITSLLQLPDGECVGIEPHAIATLGITRSEANTLFESHNTRENVTWILNRIRERRHLPLLTSEEEEPDWSLNSYETDNWDYYDKEDGI